VSRTASPETSKRFGRPERSSRAKSWCSRSRPPTPVRSRRSSSSGERCEARFRLLDAAGEPLDVEFRTKRDGHWLTETGLLEPWAEHQSETLPAGDYVLVLWHGGLAEQRIPVHLTAGGTTSLVVTLEPE
jgi:hypothetical protein